MYNKSLGAALALLTFNAFCFADELTFKPVFRLDLEQGFVGVDAQGGTMEALVEGKPEIVQGRSGKALKTGPNFGYLLFTAENMVQAEEGSIEMWICPEDWTMRDGNFHIFFTTLGGTTRAVLYKYSEGGTKFYLEQGNPGGSPLGVAAEFNGPKWDPGSWHHLAATWSSAGMQLYVDGKPVARTEMPEIQNDFGKEFRIGDRPDGEVLHEASTLIEDVRIYDKALPAELIESRFLGEEKTQATISEKQFKTKYTIKRSVGELDIATLYDGPSLKYLAARALLKKNGQVVSESGPTPFVERKAGYSLSLKGPQRGDRYTLQIDYLKEDSGIVSTQSKEIVVPSADWENNQLGLADVVPPPWVPLEVVSGSSSITVKCWGRDYIFSDSALPQQIVSQGSNLLAQPIRLVGQVKGKPVLLESKTPPRIVEATPTRVILESDAAGEVASGGVSLIVRTTLEYDGFTYSEVEIRGPGEVPFDRLSLEVAMNPSVARYWHRWNPAWDGSSGALPGKLGVLDSESFLPYVWLGDTERGLFWFCETAEHWPNRDSKNAVEIVRAANEVSMRFNLQESGQSIKAPWRFEFGLQATPVKAVPAGFRLTQLGVRPLWPSTKVPSSVKYFGYPEAANPEAFQARVNEAHEKGIKIIPYSILSYLSEASPEWKWFQDEWSNPLSQSYDTSADVAEYGYDGGIRGVHPGSKTFSDFIIWKNMEMLKTYKVDGFYHDNSWVMASDSAVVGDGWTDEKGVRRPTYPVRATRDLYRRLYKAVKAENPNAVLISHISGKIWIPHLAYEDGWLLGENLRESLKESYVDIAPLSTFQAEFSGRQWGLKSYFLPHFTKEVSTKVGPNRELASLLILHDIAAWPSHSSEELERPFRILEDFGYHASRFLPYFSDRPPATSNDKDVHASVYVRDGGQRAAVVVANLGKTPRKGTLTFDEKVIGWPVAKVSALDGGDAPVLQGQTMTASLSARDYRILLIEGASETN